jgi:hypothetical protein
LRKARYLFVELGREYVEPEMDFSEFHICSVPSSASYIGELYIAGILKREAMFLRF